MKPEDMKALTKPFPEDDIEWRLQSCGEKDGRIWGKVLAYITSRAVQDRLDEVCGPDNWQTSIRKEGDAYLCTLSIRVTHDDGSVEWISRTDGADSTDIEAVKGGISGSIKRAAVHFGIGRYLYNLKENWANISTSGKFSGKTKEGKWFKWNPPALPTWALPESSQQKTQQPVQQNNLTPEENKQFLELKAIANDMLNKNALPNNMAAQLEHVIAIKDVAKLNSYVKYASEMLSKQKEAIF